MKPNIQRQENISEFLNWLKKMSRANKEIEKIILFGSFARGDASQVSDIDLSISLKDVSQWSTFAQQLREGAPVLRKLDLVCFEKTSDRLRKKILIEGIVIYEK